MFGEALKLYLKYPAEMEYWAGKDEEEGEIDEDLVSEIAEEERDAFLSALSEVYELALEQFNDGIISPLREALNSAAGKEGITLSRPRRKDGIADQLEWRVRSQNNMEGGYRSIGCSFFTERSGDESVLNIYPWVWTRGGMLGAQRLAERLGDGWCVCDGDGWVPGAIRHEPRISIRPESKSDAVVESIAGCLVPQMRLLAQETTHPAH